MRSATGAVTAVLLSAVAAAATGERPSAEATSGPTDRVRVSPSGHYFTYTGRTRLLLCDSGTQCVMQNLNVDYRAWVKQCAADGHPGVHIWAFVPPRQKLDGAHLERRWGYRYRGATPWRRKAAGPKAYDGGYQWDLTAFDEGHDPDKHYWPRLRDLCLQLKKRDMVLGITVFFGWPKDIPGDLHYHPFFHLNGGPARTRQDITHIAKPGTEIHAREWSDDWPTRMKTQWLWERFCLKLIEQTRPFGNVWFDFRDEWSYDNSTNLEGHFRGFFLKRGQLWADRSRQASFRVSNPGVPAWAATPAMKTEGGPYDHEGVRREVWRRATGGVHYMLHNDNRSPGIMAWDPKTAKLKRLDPYKDPGRKYVGIAARLFNRHVARLDKMAPANGLVDGKATCLAAPGDEYVIYLPSGRKVTVDLSSARAPLSARWYDPRTGRFGDPVAVEGGARRSFVAPSKRDWVLHVARSAAGGRNDDR